MHPSVCRWTHGSWVASGRSPPRSDCISRASGAVAGLEHVHLLVVGDGPERADVGEHAQDVLGERATFAGTLDDVVPAYRAIDVLLVTSRTEGMPGVVLEASMSGVPVVATRSAH